MEAAPKNPSSFFCGDRMRYIILAVTTITLIYAYSNTMLYNFTVICMTEDKLVYSRRNLTAPPRIRPVSIFSHEEQAALYSMIGIGTFVSSIIIYKCIKRVGGRWTFAGYGICSGIATMLLPFCVDHSFAAVIVVRLLQGIGSGMSFVSVGYVATAWSPTQQRGLFMSFLTMYNQVSSLVSQPLAGFFCTSSFGWQSMYYLQGAITIGAFIIFFLVYADNPRDHRFVSDKEAAYIEGPEPSIAVDDALPKVPYSHIFSDPAMIGTFIVATGNFFCFNIFMLFAPIYLNKVLELDIQRTGLISSLPYLGNIIIRAIIGPVSDKLTILSPQNSVRLFMGLSQFTMSFCYIALALIPTEAIGVAQSLYFIAIMASAFNSVGYFKSVSLSCGPYTAKVMTMISFLYSIVLTVLPIIKYFVAGDDEPEQWQNMFFGTAAMGIICVCIYIYTVEVNLRPWAELPLKSRRTSLSSAQVSRRQSLNSIYEEEEKFDEKKQYY